jgi:hypothetical protein
MVRPNVLWWCVLCRHCPTTNFSASLRCNRNVATGYLDEEESRAFAATEGTGLVYSFQTSPKEGEEINGSGKEDRVREGEFRSETFPYWAGRS